MVETKWLHTTGTNSGAIKRDAIMVGVNKGQRIIAAPEAQSESSIALILWEPAHKNDRKPTHDKVVCIFFVAFRILCNT